MNPYSLQSQRQKKGWGIVNINFEIGWRRKTSRSHIIQLWGYGLQMSPTLNGDAQRFPAKVQTSTQQKKHFQIKIINQE